MRAADGGAELGEGRQKGGGGEQEHDGEREEAGDEFGHGFNDTSPERP